jgi:hypothetical protein
MTISEVVRTAGNAYTRAEAGTCRTIPALLFPHRPHRLAQHSARVHHVFLIVVHTRSSSPCTCWHCARPHSLCSCSSHRCVYYSSDLKSNMLTESCSSHWPKPLLVPPDLFTPSLFILLFQYQSAMVLPPASAHPPSPRWATSPVARSSAVA